MPILWNARIHLVRKAADFRMSIDGLSGLVRTALEADPSSGQLLVFHNRQRTAVKAWSWD